MSDWYEKALANAKKKDAERNNQGTTKKQTVATQPTGDWYEQALENARKKDAQRNAELKKQEAAKAQPLPENKRAGTGKFVGQALYTGLTSGNKGLAQTADFFLPDMLTPAAVQKGIDYYKSVGEKNEEKLAQMSDTKGRQFAGQLISGAVNMAPSAALAFLTGGTSAAGGALAANGGAALTTKAALDKAIKEAAKNPMFINSALQTLGPTYEKEREAGASELGAGAAALANALMGAAVETSGGVETIKKGGSALKNILRTAGEEGLEEAGQYSIENLANKAMGANTAKWFSMDETEDAVINPVAQAKAAASGAILGGLMGGAQTAAVKAVNKAIESKQTPQPLPAAKTAEKNAKFYMAPETQKKIFDAVEKRSGAKIQFADLPDGIDGSYENGVITVSNEAKNPAYTVLKHELTHYIEKSGDYQALSDFIEKNMRERGDDVDAQIRSIIEDYAKIGQNLTPEQAKKEYVAKFSEEYLFNSEKSIERLARENPNLFQRIYDWIVDTIAKMGADSNVKFLINAQRKYERALRTVGKSTYTGPALNSRQFLYAGESALTADRQMLQDAMQRTGQQSEQIWKETGWKRNQDGKWRFEINDQNASFNRSSAADLNGNISGQKVKLSQVLTHDDLYAAYPQLKDVEVEFVDNLQAPDGTRAGGLYENGKIKIDPAASDAKIESTLIHELQHAIQEIEGFERGGNYQAGLEALRRRITNKIEEDENSEDYQRLTEARYRDAINGTNEAEQFIDNLLMQKYNVNDINRIGREGYWLLTGEREARSAAGRGKFPETFRREMYPDYDEKALTRADYYPGTKSPQSALEVYSQKGTRKTGKRNSETGLESIPTNPKMGAQYNDRLGAKPEGLLPNLEAGNGPAFSMQESFDSDGNQLSPQQQEFFKDSKIRDEDGNLRIVYHGTTEKFTVFDRTKGRANMDIQGMFFSPWEDDAGGYGDDVKSYYLNIKNPAPESLGYKALRMFQGQNGAGVKAREYLEKLGYDGVNNGDEEYIAFYPEQIKLANNERPTASEDVRYSAGSGLQTNDALKKASQAMYTDSEGNELTAGQKKFFRNSKVRDSEGNLKVMYHGTGSAGFTVFNPSYSGDGQGLFFTDSPEVARGYSATEKEFTPHDFKTPKELQEYILDEMGEEVEIKKNGDRYELWQDGEFVVRDRDLHALYWDFNDEIVGYGGDSGNYKVYLNLENPLVVDAHNDNWDEITVDWEDGPTTTNNIAWYAMENGYDGVVINNVVDIGIHSPTRDMKPSTVAVAFNPNQIKAVSNAEPTKDDDIRYSGGENLKRDAALYKASQTLYKEKGNRYINNMETPEAGERLASFISETPVRGEKKATSYQRRARRNAKEAVKNILGVSKFADSRKIDAALDEAIEKMKTHSFTNAERDALFDEMFSEGIVVNQKMVSQYANLKQTLRNTQLHVTKDVANNIADFNDFRKRNLNNIRLSNEGGSEIDTFYDEVQRDYPELFPNLNTPAEMLETLSAVGKSIKETETRLQEMYDEDFDAFYQASRESFDREMDKLQNESTRVSRYLKDRNKKISVADAKVRIEEIGRLRREADKVKAKEVMTDIDKTYVEMLHTGKLDEKGVRYLTPLSADAIMRVYAAEVPLKQAQAALKEIGAQTRTEYRQLADQMLSGSELWKDKSAGWKYGRETAERNMYDIAGKSGERLAKEFFEPVHTAEAISTKMKNDLRSTVRELNISTKDKYDVTNLTLDAPGLTEQINEARSKGKRVRVSEATLVQLYGEGLISVEDLEHVKADVKKIQSAVSEMRNIYNQLIDAANRELIRHGYEPIEYRQNYFPHFTEDKPDGILANIASKLGFNIVKDELPTDIAGLTHTFKPGKKWFGNALQRTSRVTEYDAVKGFDIYLEGIADVIHHTENIQKLRQLETELRYRYSTEGVKAEINRINNDQDMSEVQKQAMLDQVYEKSNTHLGNLAVWLRGYTDSLAGKKAQIDRTFEHNIGRGLYNTSKALENRVAANMVAINPGSWLTNFIPLIQGSEVKNSNIIKGMAQTINNHFNHDGVADASAFVTNRKGSDVLWKSTTEVWQDRLTKPMQVIDSFVSESLVRARYLEELDKGKNPYEAMKIADDFAAGVIADRSKGALPTMFNAKNPISKILTMYQVEVNNQWSHLFKDIPRTEENVMKVAWAYAKFAIGAYIFNDVYEALIGRRPALDPLSWINDFVGDMTGKQIPNFVTALIEAAKGEGLDLEEKDEKGAAGAVTSLGENIAENIPFVGGLLGGGRVPIQSALPDFTTLATSTADLLSGENQKKAISDIGKEILKPATYMVPPVGGGQLKRVGETAVNYARGGNYAVNKDGERELRFAVDKGILPTAQSAVFGQYSGKNAVKYVEGGFKRLSAKETQAYESLINSGADPLEAEDFLRGLPDKKSEVKTAILNSGYTAAQKNAIGKALYPDDNMDFANKSELKYSTLPEASKEKVKGLKDAGLSTESALKAYEVQKKYSSDVEKAYALMQQDYYKESVLKALEISENTAEKAKALDKAGVSMDVYQAAKNFADSDLSGNVSKEEAIAYFKKKNFSKDEKYALLKALTTVKDKNNPYR